MALRGQVAVVTGGARGVGRAIATSFAREGAKLGLVDLDAERLAKTAGELRDLGAEVLAVTADVSNEDDVRRLMRQVVDTYGRLDVQVNNAGIATHGAWVAPWPSIRDMDQSFWDRVVQTNLGGTFLCTKHALEYMRPRRSGHIISLYGGGDVKRPGTCVYMVTKEAIRTFTRFVAEEERDANICILVVNPGAAIATEDAPEEVRKSMPGPDYIGNGFVQAAEAGMDMSGQLYTAAGGQLKPLA